jgi:2-phosphosulfolactate phosphatase
MRIEVVDHVAGAERARDVAIVIDVFRACSVVAYALARGAERIVPVADVADARALKAAHADWLLVGERNSRKLDGFDAGNSPTELEKLVVRGKTIIHTTHAGTQGLTAAARVADAVFTGALVNASATVAAVRALAPKTVTIVRMGHQAIERCAEDDLCAAALTAGLECGSIGLNTSGAAAQLRAAPAAQKFFDAEATWAPEADFFACTAVDAFSFAVRWRRAPDGVGALYR